MEETARIPVVMVTSLQEADDRVRALEAGADDFISKPFDKSELCARTASLVKVKAYNDYMRGRQKELEGHVAERTAQLEETRDELEDSYVKAVILSSDLISLSDEEVGSHCRRTAHYAKLLGEKIGLDQDIQKEIIMAAMFHDVGLIGFPKESLEQAATGRTLSPELMEQYKEHPNVKFSFFENIKRFEGVRSIIAAHHEYLDGSGFPRGLKGNEIPFEACILAVVNRYDIIMSTFPECNTPHKALAIMQGEEAGRYDQDIISVFSDLLESDDPFSFTMELAVNGLEPNMVVAKAIRKKDGTILLGAGTILRQEHIDILLRYDLYGNLQTPLVVYDIL